MGPYAAVADPKSTGNRLQHLLQAANHLQAAGESQQAQRLRQLADREIQTLSNRLAALQAEVDPLRRLTGSKPVVRVEVQVMELARSKLRSRGFDFSKLGGKTGGAAAAPGDGETFAFQVIDQVSPVPRVLESLRKDGLMKVLAEPTLMTIRGRPASFVSGGEFPVLVAQHNGSVATEYKTYGTQVDLVATVLGNRNIRLEIRTNLSEVDPELQVQVGDRTFPGLRTRQLDTGVEMEADQTLLISGLVQTRVTSKPDDSKAEPQTPKPNASGVPRPLVAGFHESDFGNTVNFSSSKLWRRLAGVDGHRRKALVGEPPDPQLSGGSLALDPGHPQADWSKFGTAEFGKAGPMYLGHKVFFSCGAGTTLGFLLSFALGVSSAFRSPRAYWMPSR